VHARDERMSGALSAARHGNLSQVHKSLEAIPDFFFAHQSVSGFTANPQICSYHLRIEGRAAASDCSPPDRRGGAFSFSSNLWAREAPHRPMAVGRLSAHVLLLLPAERSAGSVLVLRRVPDTTMAAAALRTPTGCGY